MTRESTSEELRRCLENSDIFNEKTTIKGDFIVNCQCPGCGKIKASVHRENPFRLFCWSASCENSKDSGGLDLVKFFNINTNYEKRFSPDKKRPNRPAIEFLVQERALPRDLVENFIKPKYVKNVRRTGTGAACWLAGSNANGEEVWSGRRFCTTLDDEQKGHGWGSQAGVIGSLQGKEINPAEAVFVVEGGLDCFSLWAMSFQSLYLFSANADPAKLPDLKKYLRPVWLFDNDKAGHKCLKRFKKAFPESAAMLLPPGMDTNDILQKHGLEKGRKYLLDNREKFENNAALALAVTSRNYAEIYADFHGCPPGLFEHDGSTFFAWIKKHGDSSNLVVERCGKFTLKVISYLKDTSNEDQQYFYHLQITPKGGRPVKVTASGRDIATPRGIKEFFLTRAKVCYEGAANSAVALATKITSAKQAPEVTRIQLTGLDIKSNWYIFQHWAIDPTGKIYHPDRRGLFKINFREWATPPPHATEKAIKPALNGIAPKAIHNLVVAAYGQNGAAAMAWMVAGWFVYQVKEQIGYFPHLAATGDPASGKSALTVILNALQGIDGEGTPISQLNSKKGLARTIARESGRFTALLEDSQRNERGFDYSIVLTGYNKGPLQVQAAFSNDLKTKTNEFLGSLFFVSNLEPFKDKQEKQRVISLTFDHDGINEETRQAYEKLCKIPLLELARFMVCTLENRKVFESEWPAAYEQAIDDLSPLENRRILQNHALILAFHRLFCKINGIDYDLTSFMKKLAETKCVTSAARAYTAADHFFEILDNIPEEKTETCMHLDAKKRMIFINLPGAEQLIRNRGLQFSINDNLITALKNHPAYVRHGFNFRYPGSPELDIRGNPKQRKSWVFDPAGFEK